MPKCEVIAIANQKGGLGKTTTFNLGVALVNLGKKVLLIDADPKADLTTYMGWHNADNITDTLATIMNKTIADVEDVNPKDILLKHEEGVYLLPSNLELASTEVSLQTAMCREYTMRNSISSLKEQFDYILIDCMPSLAMLTINALASADKVIIPVQSEFLAAKGMSHLLSTILKVRKQINPNLKVGGILLTMVDGRTNLAKDIRTELAETYGKVFTLFETQIPRAVRAAESTRYGESIISHDKNSKVAESYLNFAKEVLNNEREEKTRNTNTVPTR